MAYSKRTCEKCGYRSIQPNMKQIEIEYNSGSSHAGMSKRALGFALLGEKKANNQLGNWMSGNTKRKYMRKRKVWVCDERISYWYRESQILESYNKHNLKNVVLFLVVWESFVSLA